MAHALRSGLRNGGLRRGGLHAGLEGGSIFNIASLDLNFARYKNIGSLVTFTRASSGTFVGSDGVLRTAVTNLLLQSEDFSTSWFNFGTTETVNATTAPNGTNTADEIIEDTTNANHIVVQNFASTSGTVYSFSCYLKAGVRSFAFLDVNATGTLHAVSVNLSTGAVSTAIGSPTGATSIVLPNGWYRVAFSYTSGTTGTVSHEIRISTDGVWANRTYTGNGTGSVFAWGAQLELSATVGEYIPTTSTINSAPRFDHNPITGESLGLLVEEARTNLQVRSEEFDNTGTWSRTGLSTVTANSSIAPDSLTTADTLVEDASTGSHRVFATTSSLAASTSYSLSVYVKASTRTIVRVEVRDSVGAFAAQDFNLTTQAIISAGSGTGAISALGNGWFRCTVTGTTSVLGGVGVVLIYSMQVAGNATYTGTNGTSAILLWGAQVEAGAFPTSYIPTTSATATATRSADVASITAANFSSWYNQTEGTVFAASSIGSSSYAGGVLWDIGSAGAFGTSAYTNWNGSQWTLNPGSAPMNLSSIVTTSAFAANAAALKGNDSVLAANGLIGAVDSSCSMPASPTTLLIGKGGWSGATNWFNGTIRRLTYWPTRLANTTLQSITQ